jgi:hypothetical protein
MRSIDTADDVTQHYAPENGRTDLRRGVIPMYFKINELLPHLGELDSHLLPEMSSSNYRGDVMRLEMLPYALTAMQAAFYQCVETQGRIFTRLEQRGLETGVTLHLLEEREELGFAVDSFLETAVRCQNALIPYLEVGCRATLPKSRKLPKSLADLVPKIERGDIDLGKIPNDLVTGHWKAHGKRLRAYRDLSQHFAIVSSDPRVFRGSDGRLFLYLLLPTNPEAKDPARLQYENPHVHAYMYIRDYFHRLFGIVYHLTRHLKERFPDKVNPDGTRTFVLRPLLPRAPIVFGGGHKIEGQRIMIHDEMRQEIEARIVRNKELYDRHLRSPSS